MTKKEQKAIETVFLLSEEEVDERKFHDMGDWDEASGYKDEE